MSRYVFWIPCQCHVKLKATCLQDLLTSSTLSHALVSPYVLSPYHLFFSPCLLSPCCICLFAFLSHFSLFLCPFFYSLFLFFFYLSPILSSCLLVSCSRRRFFLITVSLFICPIVSFSSVLDLLTLCLLSPSLPVYPVSFFPLSRRLIVFCFINSFFLAFSFSHRCHRRQFLCFLFPCLCLPGYCLLLLWFFSSVILSTSSFSTSLILSPAWSPMVVVWPPECADLLSLVESLLYSLCCRFCLITVQWRYLAVQISRGFTHSK